MTSSISWIDRDGLESTLARFASRGWRPRDAAASRPEGGEASQVAHPVIADQPKLAAVPSPEAEAGVQIEIDTELEAETDTELEAGLETEEPATPEFVPPTGPLRQRLDAFMSWLIEASGTEAAFIVDRDGLPLVDRAADPDLLAIASSVMRLVESINSKLLFPVGRAVNLEIEDGQLSMMSVETSVGKYIVGLVGDRPIDSELRSTANEALRRAFQPSVEQQATGA